MSEATPAATTVERLRSSRSAVIWAGLLVPPLAWVAHVVFGDFLFELGCAPGGAAEPAGLSLSVWAVVATAAAALATAAAGLGAALAWRRLRNARDGVSLGRARALAGMGALHSVLYLALIVFGLFPPLLLEPCARLL